MYEEPLTPFLSKKICILDTNVLLHDPQAIFGFEGVCVGIPMIVLEELDTFKKEGTDRGRNSRESIRILDGLRVHGSLKNGVILDNGGTVKVIFLEEKLGDFPFHAAIADNEILLSALSLKNNGHEVVFISKDLNARIKADALGIAAQDYIKEQVNQEDFYKGWIRVQVPAVQLKKEYPPVLDELLESKCLEVNQFIIVESQHNPYNFVIFRYRGGKNFKAVHDPQLRWPLQARNPQQLMALDLLLDDTVQFVTLMGPAGTGKTFLALLAGLHEVLVKHTYQKMLVSRPIIPLGKDIGFLPGELKEKLHNWMLPIYDNMDFIIHSAHQAAHKSAHQTTYLGKQEFEEKSTYKNRNNHKDKEKQEKDPALKGLLSLNELIYRGKVALEAITYMRGRSIPYQFILIDEAQNLTPHEIKALVTRVGEGSKIILTGDPYQIDSPYLDFSSNGLVTSSERFKGQNLFGSVYLPVSERGELSKIAGELL